MNALFYFGHPAQFHFGKYIISSLLKNGHQVKILLKTKDVLEDLVKETGFEYENIQYSVRKSNTSSILIASLKRTIKVLKAAKKFKADILIGTDSSIAQASFFLKKKSLTTLEDDYEVIKNLARLTFPFCSYIVVPSVCEVGNRWGYKKISYSGYMKLACLHPNRFIPDETVVKKYIDSPGYCIIRMAGLTAHHDTGINGLNLDLIKKIVQLIENQNYVIYISSESKLPDDLAAYQLKINPTDMHHVLSYASLLISDSQSMTMEAAMLGTPSIRFSDFAGKISVLEELEHTYQLTFGISATNEDKLLLLVNEVLGNENIKNVFSIRREKMLSEKIDVTAFFVWLIENYPKSIEVLKKDPDYQYRFK